MMNTKLRIGIIGCGWVTTHLHVPALRRIGTYDIVAVADIDLERAESLAARIGIRRSFQEPSQLIEHPDVEAVAVCVPPDQHLTPALAAIHSGKHVFIEKPLALSLYDADRLIDAARGQQTKVLVGFNLRWHRLVRQGKELLDAHALGPLVGMRTMFTNALRHDARSPAWRRDRACGGGVVYDLAVHHFDLWRFLLSSEVCEVSAICQSDHWQDDAAVVSARMADGTLVSSIFAHGTTENHRIEVYGEKGHLQISPYRFDGLEHCLRQHNGTTGFFRRVTAKATALPAAISAFRYGGEIFASYDAQWRHFFECVRRDAPVSCTLDDGRRAVELALAVNKSSLKGQPISLKVSQSMEYSNER